MRRVRTGLLNSLSTRGADGKIYESLLKVVSVMIESGKEKHVDVRYQEVPK